MTSTATSCFNCGTAATSLFFMHVESRLNSPAMLYAFNSGWIYMPCPYCQYDAYWGVRGHD